MEPKKFAVLQLTGCSGCEVSFLNSETWVDTCKLVYMPLVISAEDMEDVDLLLVTGGVHTDEDMYNLRQATRKAKQIAAVGTCAISGGVINLGQRDGVRELFIHQKERRHVLEIMPKCKPVDEVAEVDLYLPGCPPTPNLFLALLDLTPDFKAAKSVCSECGKKKRKDMRPSGFFGLQKGAVIPDICLINQGYLCIGSSTRGGCQAPCTHAGYPCVGCRGPSDSFIDKKSGDWMVSIKQIFTSLTEVPPEEVDRALFSPCMSLFLFQFFDHAEKGDFERKKEKFI